MPTTTTAIHTQIMDAVDALLDATDAQDRAASSVPFDLARWRQATEAHAAAYQHMLEVANDVERQAT